MTRTTPRPAARRAHKASPTGQGRPVTRNPPAPYSRGISRRGTQEKTGIYDRLALRLENITGHPLTEGKVRHALTRAQQDGWLTPGKRGGSQRGPGPRLLAAWEEERTVLRRPAVALGNLPHLARAGAPTASPTGPSTAPAHSGLSGAAHAPSRDGPHARTSRRRTPRIARSSDISPVSAIRRPNRRSLTHAHCSAGAPGSCRRS